MYWQLQETCSHWGWMNVWEMVYFPMPMTCSRGHVMYPKIHIKLIFPMFLGCFWLAFDSVWDKPELWKRRLIALWQTSTHVPFGTFSLCLSSLYLATMLNIQIYRNSTHHNNASSSIQHIASPERFRNCSFMSSYIQTDIYLGPCRSVSPCSRFTSKPSTQVSTAIIEDVSTCQYTHLACPLIAPGNFFAEKEGKKYCVLRRFKSTGKYCACHLCTKEESGSLMSCTVRTTIFGSISSSVAGIIY